MPTYDYECPKCGYEFELFQQMTETPISKCPKCNSKEVKRLIGAGTGIIFKGTGFYETDYKRKESKTEHKAESKETKKEGKKAESCSTCSEKRSCAAADKKS